MTPGRYDLAIYRGDTYQWRFTLWQDAGMTVPVDVTVGDVESEIRNRSAGDLIVAMACTVTAPNIIDVVLPADDSATLPTSGVWDLQVTYPGDIVRTYVAGRVAVTADVTDSVPAPAAARSRRSFTP
jgi:hypothetical protein